MTRNFYAPYSLQGRRRRHLRNGSKPEPERNIPAAFFSLVVGGIYAVAMAEPKWLKINGGKCNNMAIGLYKIFGVGRHSSPTYLEDVYCMNKNVLLEMRLIAASCILAIVISLIQFGLDVWGTTARGFRVIRKTATGDIIAVLLSVLIMVLCYMVVLEVQNMESKPGKEVKVTLDIAFYLVIGAGVNAVVATTLNLMQCNCEKKQMDSDHDMMLDLMYEEDLIPPDYDLPPMPPAYENN